MFLFSEDENIKKAMMISHSVFLGFFKNPKENKQHIGWLSYFFYFNLTCSENREAEKEDEVPVLFIF